MKRADLIEACINGQVWANEGEINSVLDVAEPLIRADERQRLVDPVIASAMQDAGYQAGREHVLADLRTEVQVMHDEAGQALLYAETHDEVTAASVGISVLDDILRLFDGDDDD